MMCVSIPFVGVGLTNPHLKRTRTLSILWTPEQNFVLSFGGFVFKNAHYFEFMLNTQRNMKELLEVTCKLVIIQ